MNDKINQLKVKIFLDNANKANILSFANTPYIQGVTTNPTLMRQEGVTDFRLFAQEVLALMPDRPISFGVLTDDFSEMEQQALMFSSWGENVYVKIPITNTRGESCYALVKRLVAQHVKLNITAIMTLNQVRHIMSALSPKVPSYLSIFAGRIADTGQDPIPIMAAALELIRTNPRAELIWASPRELLNIFQANAIGCDIITITQEVVKKLSLVGYDLEAYSLDTVKMFHRDATDAGFTLSKRSADDYCS